MTFPTATYRLQFRNGMTFERAQALAPYLAGLGISHLYCSPIFTATSGSTHGYDVVDANEIDPTIGGMDGFLAMAGRFKDEGIEIVLDIVPNHMATSLENAWWRNVIEWGRRSAYAHYFDIDWSRKLTLPVLAEPLEDVLAGERIALAFDDRHQSLAADYMGSLYPLDPQTYSFLINANSPEILRKIGATGNGASPDDPARFRRKMDEFDPCKERIDRELSRIGRGDCLREVLSRQPWQLVPWQEAATSLSYRRFFEISGLVGVRVEDDDVFEAMHRTVCELVDRGIVEGLRLDHIDGLADPATYLERLRRRCGDDIYIVVEKILEHDEQLPDTWPIEGSTGYEFINAVSDLFRSDRERELDDAYRIVAGYDYEPARDFDAARTLMIETNFAGEVETLERLAVSVAHSEEEGTAPEREAIVRALRDLLRVFPVYRTYCNDKGLTRQDEKVLLEAFAKLYAESGYEHAPALRCLQAILRCEVSAASLPQAQEFRTRFQQLTGPLLAKSLEDTFFYRYGRLLALNEVGCDPMDKTGSVERFHERMLKRFELQPFGLSASSTHDTKRGEDARARIFAISEDPAFFSDAVGRWRDMSLPYVALLPDGPAPEPALEWIMFQSLLGAWRGELPAGDPASLASLQDRFVGFVEKCVREAKQRGNWINPDTDYERAAKEYATKILSADNPAFFRDFEKTARSFVLAGYLNSLTATAIKLTAPGVPDIYQGSEFMDFSLVDPDNRQTLDICGLSARSFADCGFPQTETEFASAKFRLISTLLNFRRRNADLFWKGDYIPLFAEGNDREHIVSFARQRGNSAILVVCERLMFAKLQDESGQPRLSVDTILRLPPELAVLQFRDIFGKGPDLMGSPAFAINDLMRDSSIAIYVSEG